MSAIIARMVFGVTIAVVAAVVYVYSNRRNANNPQESHRSSGNRDSSDYEPRNRWEREDYYEDDEKPLHQANKRTRTHVDHLDSNSSTSSDGLDIVKKCGICLELFTKLKQIGVEIHSTQCGHIFCIRCLNQSFRSSKQCPQCRQIINRKQTLRLYL